MSSNSVNPVAAEPPLQPGQLLLPAPLAPQAEISRELSVSEYYYASIGSSTETLDDPREIVYVLEGQGSLTLADWQQALDAVVRVHPGSRLRLVGERRKARWESDGQPPRLRRVTGCGWDGQLKTGSEFITAEPLGLVDLPCCELIVAECMDCTRVIFRVLHAVMDGRGGLHFLRELFRALRGEPLQPTNAVFRDVDLMRSLSRAYPAAKAQGGRYSRTVCLTGAAMGDETGETWQRLTLYGAQRDFVARVAEAMAEYVHRDSELPALFSVPVDLRRHLPALSATMMFTSVLSVRLNRGEGAAAFKRNMDALLAARRDVVYLAIIDLLRWLPFRWIDRLMSRTVKNYRRKPARNTSVISNLGRLQAAEFSTAGFEVAALYFVAEQDCAYCMMTSLGDRSELIVGMPRVHASEGRLAAFMHYLEQRLTAPGSGPAQV